MRPVLRRNQFDVVVVGGGMAGLTAAWQAASYGLSTALAERSFQYGGQIANKNHVDGFPSVGDTSGAALSSSLYAAAHTAGVTFIQHGVRALQPDGRGFSLELEDEVTRVRGRRVVLASGGRARTLGVPGEAALDGRGISHCATCDGPLYRNRDVVVVGGGDAALQEAPLLAERCASVTLIVRGQLRARRSHIDRATEKANIRFVWDSSVVEIIGQDVVEGVRIQSSDSGQQRVLACQGVFPLIGQVPNTEFLPQGLILDETGQVVTDTCFGTSLPGVYAVGAVRSGYDGQLTSAVAEGAAAARLVATS